MPYNYTIKLTSPEIVYHMHSITKFPLQPIQIINELFAIYGDFPTKNRTLTITDDSTAEIIYYTNEIYLPQLH